MQRAPSDCARYAASKNFCLSLSVLRLSTTQMADLDEFKDTKILPEVPQESVLFSSKV